jgi:hypothetical protein
MLENGIYGLYFTATQACACESESSQALAVLRDGRVLGSDPWGGVFAGSCEFDPTDRANKVRLQFGVPPEGTLVTGFAAGPEGAVLEIAGTVQHAGPQMTTVVEVAGAPVNVQLTYLGPLPS